MDTIAAVNANLYSKMEETFQDFTNWLLKQSPEDILDHAYEYAIKENILLVMEYNDLEEDQVNALLASEDPLDLLYNEVGDSATISLDALLTLIEDKADQMTAPKESYADIQVYPFSAEVAEQEGDLEWYRQSQKLNVVCKDAIEAAISRHYKNNTLDSVAVHDVVEQFGWPRTAFVLANTVRSKDWDARFSRETKDWAKRIPIYPDTNTLGENKRLRYVVNSHSGLTDLFISSLRREYQQQQEQPQKESVRQKLQTTAKTTSPRRSAKIDREAR